MEASPPAGLRKAVAQRNQAIACAVLSIVISLALVMNQFLDRRQELKDANGQIVALQDAVRSNQQALIDTQQALGRLLESQAKGKFETRAISLWLEWFSPRDNFQIYAVGAGIPVGSVSTDRGLLNNGLGNQSVRAGDEITLRPVLHARDGNVLGVKIEISGPGLENGWAIFGAPYAPKIFDGELGLSGDYKVKLVSPGSYKIVLTGYSVWPVMTYRVEYSLNVTVDGK